MRHKRTRKPLAKADLGWLGKRAEAVASQLAGGVEVQNLYYPCPS